uniref:Uncharacterized protein n=1 Tax=Glossina palpalis gambiensis TaxID=67801 RepID=A0A1B0BQI4_9MUSC
MLQCLLNGISGIPRILTSTRPKMMPAPIVPMPAKKNGIETCSRIAVHFSCLRPGRFRANFSSTLPGTPAILEASVPPRPPPIPPPPLPPEPGSGSEDAMDVVMIELNEPVVECGRPDNFSLSVS